MRYFFFSYNFTCNSNFEGFGNVIFESNGMPKHKRIKEICEKQVLNKFPHLQDINVIIMGWNELKKKDYNDFIQLPIS